MGGRAPHGLASLIQGNLRLLIDECLSPELAEIAGTEFGCYAIHVPWLGAPPAAQRSWKDRDIVKRALSGDYVLVTNNRRDFVEEYFPASGAEVHPGLIIIIEKSTLNVEITLFRAVMTYVKTMESTVNTLVEIDASGKISVAEWPNLTTAEPWRDPFKPG